MTPTENSLPKVLIVDDDRLLVAALTVRLRAAGMAVVTSTGAHDAAAVALHERPDVILLDIHMPGYSGLEFHECLQFAAHGRGIPIIYLSGSVSPSERSVALRQGAKAVLSKPCEPQMLLDTIRLVVDASVLHAPLN